MSGKMLTASALGAVALGLVLLLGLHDGASADTIKVNHSASLDCGGADDNEGTAADNSCAAGTGKNVNTTADVETVFDIGVAHANSSKVVVALASGAFRFAMAPEIPNGAAVGVYTTLTTLSLLNGSCQSAIPFTVPLFDASNDTTATIDWTGDGSNLTVDSDGNGLADGIDKYPSFLNKVYNSQRPLARYYGYVNWVAGAPPMQLNFVQFTPGVLQGTTSAPGLPKPDQELNDSVGYIAFMVLDNPDPTQAATPSPITDFCTPSSVTARLWGKTQGEGRSIPVAGGWGESGSMCTGAGIGVDNDGDTVADDGCIVVTDKCGDSIDNDADFKVDEYCPNATGLYAARVRSQNPASATSGIYGSGTHLVGAYSQGNRDADADGIDNSLDSCPTIADGRESGAQCANALDEDGDTRVNDGCPRVGAAEQFPTPNQCSDALDNDGDTMINDGCPPVQMDADNDGLGATCDPNDAVANTDQDGDTFTNRQDNCPLVANSDQLDTDSNRCNDALNSDSSDDTGVNDGCPAVGAKETACANALDDDADTLINDGCPLKGGISEFCVAATDPNVGVNDGCPASGAAESGGQCNNKTDDDGDTEVNDGCPVVGASGESVAQCDNALDDDGDAPNDWGPCSDYVGNACDANPTAVDGDYDKDMPRAAVCIGATDTDGDGWCDVAEDKLGPGGVAISDKNNVNSIPEYTGTDYPMPTGAPQSCSNKLWYASSGDPIGDGAAIDDDGDTLVNAADTNCAALGDDLKTNDGCPANDAAESGTQCDNKTDDDADTLVNDGCPQVGPTAESGAECTNAINDDGDDDQDGILGPADNCETVYNPDQLNTDTLAAGGGDTVGDACDVNDDGDGLLDTTELTVGSDPKNPQSPSYLDLNRDGMVNAADVLSLRTWIGTSESAMPAQPTQVCLP